MSLTSAFIVNSAPAVLAKRLFTRRTERARVAFSAFFANLDTNMRFITLCRLFSLFVDIFGR